MKHLVTLLGLLVGCIFGLLAQNSATQTVKGVVLDKDSKTPLIGATVYIADVEPILGTTTDENGEFKLENVPVGRHSVKCSYIGYDSYSSENAIVSAAKELVMIIELTESAFTTGEIVVVDTNKLQNKVLNDMTIVSGRSFSVEETQRYTAGTNDPGRMAMGFPGVRGNFDNNSDIIVRGNSPVGVLWRLEGIDVPNPNHFARRGSSGGGITVFSASLLANSDFSTGAFAPEYGNAFASVFDMRFRRGNNEKREYTLRAGLIGLDFSTEGYFKKNASSYLVNYRYSTLGLLNQLGFRLVGERTGNDFQDLSFNLAFPSKDKKHLVTWFGMGGLSREYSDPVKDPNQWKQYSDYAVYNFLTRTGATGVTHTVTIDDKSYLKTAVALMGNRVTFVDDTLARSKERFSINNEDYAEGRATITTSYNRKISPRVTLKTGAFVHHVFFNYFQSKYRRSTQQFDTLINGKGSTQFAQAYIQGKFKLTQRLNMVTGVHGLVMFLNGTWSLDPRLTFQYSLGNGQTLSLAYGLHSRILPMGAYFTTVPNSDGQLEYVNKELPLLKAHHGVLGYDWYGQKNWHVRLEAYYQWLTNVPVGASNNNTYWVLNDREGFPQEKMYAKGKGINYGLDLTVEKTFSNQIFFLFSSSVYRSLFIPLDGKTYSTRFDGIFNGSFMGGKEFTLKNGGVLQVGARLATAGGYHYTPADSAASAAANELVLDNTKTYAATNPFYFRLDTRVSYRISRKKIDYLLALDIQNTTNNHNVKEQIYDPLQRRIIFAYQSGLLPVASFQVNF